MRTDLDQMEPVGDGALKAKLSREALIRRIQKGEIEGLRVAGQWLVSRDSLRQFIERNAK